jgi:hypothetical protein
MMARGARRLRVWAFAVWLAAAAMVGSAVAVSQTRAADEAALIAKIDAAAHARSEHVAGYTVTEHYKVFRGGDQTTTAAAMTVKTTYKKGVGKNYEIVSQSGSVLIQRFGLKPLLENEREINDPAKVAQSWLTSDNYEMHLSPAEQRVVDGRTCIGVAIHPRRKAPNLIEGKLWVYPADGSICEVDGVASKAPSIFSGTTQMMRTYTTMQGYAMATHARAESSGVIGRTVVTIDYSDYKIETR